MHLLKANSKPVPVGRKRRKVLLAGTFTDFMESKLKQAKANRDQSSASETSLQQPDAKGMVIMAPKPNAKDAKMNQR